jgi:hypothetical protein
MKIIRPKLPEIPREIVEIRIIHKERTCPTDNRSYYWKHKETIQVAETTLDEVYNLVLSALRSKEAA